MTRITNGGCLCGAVTFRIAGEFGSFFLCHCARCRKGTGSAHAANLFSTAAEITWLSGNDGIKSYTVPGTRHERSFCTECGSALPSLQMNGALLVVPAGSLDDAPDMRPDAHICFASRARWDAGLEELPKIDGLPGQT
ncbi:GFA family protein [Arenibaculum sp.]|uniref:GFA family protein n=1 Tax=Arenibaculum sp. TaxID=2865862 RepID=UPI002E0F83DD|nr:GFA family protein [Arenibaculum sp.]